MTTYWLLGEYKTDCHPDPGADFDGAIRDNVGDVHNNNTANSPNVIFERDPMEMVVMVDNNNTRNKRCEPNNSLKHQANSKNKVCPIISLDTSNELLG